MGKSLKPVNKVVLFTGAIILFTAGFFLGKSNNGLNNEIPQGVILDSGPGIIKMQAVSPMNS